MIPIPTSPSDYQQWYYGLTGESPNSLDHDLFRPEDMDSFSMAPAPFHPS